jgi:glutaminyl-tRNA synthetase
MEAPPRPDGSPGSFTDNLNPASLELISGALGEPGLAAAMPETPYQFERVGYFVLDRDSAGGKLVFNKTIGLRDTWAKMVNKGNISPEPRVGVVE